MSDAPRPPADDEPGWASPSPPPGPPGGASGGPTGGHVPPPYQPPPYPPPPYQPPQQPGYQQYPSQYQPAPPPYGYPYQAYPVAKTEGMAIAALICAIGSFIVCIPILAIVALPLAGSAKKKIEASNGQLTGMPLITAARWVSVINLVIWVFLVGLMVIAFILDMSSTPTSDFENFERLVVP